jgi:hypothetical protein
MPVKIQGLKPQGWRKKNVPKSSHLNASKLLKQLTVGSTLLLAPFWAEGGLSLHHQLHTGITFGTAI